MSEHYIDIDFDKNDNYSGSIGANSFDDTLENLIANEPAIWGGRVNKDCDKTVPVIVTNEKISSVSITHGGTTTSYTAIPFCCNTPDF